MGFFNRSKGLAIFLWRGTDGLVQGEKAAWDAVCFPKKESGHVHKRAFVVLKGKVVMSLKGWRNGMRQPL